MTCHDTMYLEVKRITKKEMDEMFNVKEIMTNAWIKAENATFIHGGRKSEYFAECLKEEWAFRKMLQSETIERKATQKAKAVRVEKSINEITAIKDWFVRKNFTQEEAYVIKANDWIEVIEETAKAYKLVVHNADFGNITTWAPKSCCVA